MNRADDMRTSLEHLPARKRRELGRVVEILREEFQGILKTARSPARKKGLIAKIILFGSHARNDWVEDRASGYFSDFDILVIVNEEPFRDFSVYWYTAEDRILGDTSIKTPVSFIVHDLAEINNALAQGQYFFADIIGEGILLYALNGSNTSGNKRFTLVNPTPPTPKAAYELAKKYFDHWHPSAASFIKTSGYSQSEGWLNQAAFLMHQAVERFYTCTLLVLTLYGPPSHNIKFLRSLAEDQDRRLVEAWPRATKRHRANFELLKRAYVEARYSEHYTITTEQLDWLAQCARRLKDLTETICRERLAEMKAAAGEN
ncbi:MAG: HEPN domain-containing protein [Sphingomonadales bacterium]|nr:HEPN domain-containing protein [Sphingomonadales bacterium]